MKRRTFLAISVLVATLSGTMPVKAQTYSVLYSFTGGTDGAHPYSSVIRDVAGDLYGTTGYGGTSGFGVVFQLDTAGKETVLHSFTGADGVNPYAGLIRDSAGTFYGTTYGGGFIGFPACVPGCGVVFSLDAVGKETALYSFPGAPNGGNPDARVIRDSEGKLYGTAYGGGTGTCAGVLGCGVVFELDTAGNETVLHNFGTTARDGVNPYAGLIRDSAGNLFGTTSSGGAGGGGVVFKLDAAGNYKVLHHFGRVPHDGLNPYSGLIRDSAGSLYGTTSGGGRSGSGAVFRIDAAGRESVLYSFTGAADGAAPWSGLIRDSAGNLYGTTSSGGASGNGVVYKLDTAGMETVLYSFMGGTDGSYPIADLIRDSGGTLYGTTLYGGLTGAPNCSGLGGCGVVFKLKP